MKKWIYSGTREEQPSERELMHGKLARKAASEGIVLLKNEGIVLEMLTTERIVLFIRD